MSISSLRPCGYKREASSLARLRILLRSSSSGKPLMSPMRPSVPFSSDPWNSLTTYHSSEDGKSALLEGFS